MYVCMYVCMYVMTQATGKRGKSLADIQRALARRRKQISQGLPEWGKDLPDDVSAYSQPMLCADSAPSCMQFFERLELFKEESIRKQEELIDRIRKEVCTMGIDRRVWLHPL